ncbi:MAG: Ribonuclease P protein component [uncultured Nocardioides sp.]|uniref:Ribonuclease P protein component n=1 Tax=uncultured Nocardioides sp. TaxID=198441 RepID=A0A6J4P7D5_9ACTN|nr:MAG: Ribonuclease P protein component [uncultured Nocardioides sp.]
MLPVQHRLTDSETFRTAVRRGRRAGTRSLVVHVWSDPDADPAPVRVGFTVSKAVGGAVVRNRVKRRLRHLVGELLPSIETGPGRAALVVRAQPAAASASYADLGADLARCLQRVSA